NWSEWPDQRLRRRPRLESWGRGAVGSSRRRTSGSRSWCLERGVAGGVCGGRRGQRGGGRGGGRCIRGGRGAGGVGGCGRGGGAGGGGEGSLGEAAGIQMKGPH